MNLARTLSALAASLALGTPPALAVPPPFPEDHRQLPETISQAAMESFLGSLGGSRLATVTVEGKTAGGRSLFLVHLTHGGTPAWRVLFYAQQHGDEISGKDALLYLVRDLVRDPALLPPDVDLWVMPMVNPDGAEARTRRNGAGADLNRDHMVLEHPETRALHRVVQRVRPHLAVDAHEFSRDPEPYRRRGWRKWPDITMDGLDNPLFDPAVVAAAARTVEEVGAAEKKAGHPFLRYWVGGAPPDDEQRHSAPDVDGGLNAVGMYGGLSFIVEAAAPDSGISSPGDLGNRVDAYLVVFRHLLSRAGRHDADLAAIEKGRQRPLPPFLPTNYLWVKPDARVTEFPVVETATGRVRQVPTANMMTTVAVKSSVATPSGYAIPPSAAARFRDLLERHAIPFETLSAARTVRAEDVTLLRVEPDFDDLYSRYGGRQVVRRDEPRPVELAPGSLWVPLAGESALRAALLLEPASLYGLFQYPSFRALVGKDGALPILRVPRGETGL